MAPQWNEVGNRQEKCVIEMKSTFTVGISFWTLWCLYVSFKLFIVISITIASEN
jgi:hypothetical protein